MTRASHVVTGAKSETMEHGEAWNFARSRVAVILAMGLAVGGGGAPAPAAFAGAQDAVRDAQIAVAVKTALINDVVLGTAPIDVAVQGGVVTLRGPVPSAEDADRAVALARGVEGVAGVRSELVVDAARPSPRVRPERPGLPALAPRPSDAPLRLIGVGVSGAGMFPARDTLTGAAGFGPILRLRPGTGPGPTIAFSWTRARFADGSGVSSGTGLRVRPVMAGLQYGWGGGRTSAAASVVAGYAFNRLQADTGHAGAERAIAVGNSPALRVGGSLWVDVLPRIGINVFGGYLFTRPELTLASGGSVVTRRVAADTVLVSVGVAYWVF